MTRTQHVGVLAALLGSIAANGCADLLGFEPAELDPISIGSDAGTRAPLPPQVTPDAGDAAPTLCERYCDTVLAACGRDADGTSYAVYDSRLTCLTQCAWLDPGQAGDQSGNSVSCRLNSARLALQLPGERPSACPAAGPGGDGVCGTNCEGYCTLMQAECSAVLDTSDCATLCPAIPDLGGFDTSQIQGNSLQCRLYHLQAASVSPVNHCPHVAGGFPCDG
jgi:hypothetical protein